ncbi:MAG: hypothetical protein KF801_08475 [Cryobacterium sp.]|jgi:hypothetical protein|nr:hypothetical protein [Cryobacterium sp.]
MRWNNLFDDLESQLEHELSAEDIDVRVEQERLRLGRLSLRDRLLSLHDQSEGTGFTVRVEVGGILLRIAPSGFGKDWVSGSLIDETSRKLQVIVPFRSIGGVVLDRNQSSSSLRDRNSSPPGGLSDRLGLTFVLRDLARRRCELDLVTASGTFHGTIDRVGRDHCDLAVHEAGTPRRESAVSHYRIVPIDQLLLVRL